MCWIHVGYMYEPRMGGCEVQGHTCSVVTSRLGSFQSILHPTNALGTMSSSGSSRYVFSNVCGTARRTRTAVQMRAAKSELAGCHSAYTLRA